ncbi:hypothetical protein Amet_4125 [Alkaliphilus metalliredigens QYMF]|uniref:Copper amine oxidase-like N-terminal domain-containing protein n=1 Tax=Alkaliphilus metalliredigens (strain QYMF) TaxID=293826 RepID=A6TVI8_ALKMQ|nr:copper amine oxidase N-terminal domain-containing protein [Alkaliphilus metalliredigens]ABR50206.1 hypothetical protein Amet_4125 [Alkaliphilus metalliredigens QYMF]
MKKIPTTLLVLYLLFLSSFIVFASTHHQSIQVYFGDFKVQHHKDLLSLEESPFLYEGRLYMPLRALSESLGYDVDWDENTQTAILSKDTAFTQIPETDPLNGEAFVYGEVRHIDYENRSIDIVQHLDHHSREVFEGLLVEEDAIIILQRNDHQWNIAFSDVKVGDVVGMVLTAENLVRGIIVD